jgi:hypothetical protein
VLFLLFFWVKFYEFLTTVSFDSHTALRVRSLYQHRRKFLLRELRKIAAPIAPTPKMQESKTKIAKSPLKPQKILFPR